MRTIGDILTGQYRGARKQMRELCEQRDKELIKGNDISAINKKIIETGKTRRRLQF